MRFIILEKHARCLKQSVAIGFFTVLATGCSSNFSRFSMEKYVTTIQPKSNVRSINSYPKDVDPITTSSISRARDSYLKQGPNLLNARPIPDLGIGKKPLANQQYNQGMTRYSRSSTAVPRYARQQKRQVSSVRNAHDSAYPVNIDQKINSSVRSATLPAVPNRSQVKESVKRASSAGWTKTDGSIVSLQRGESLFNLSKRYGVPVDKLKKINKISDSNQLHAGQNIIIPVYNYSASVPVSAPDNDPGTRAARASTGMIGGSMQETVVIPAKSPGNYIHKTVSALKKDKSRGGDRSKKTLQERQNIRPGINNARQTAHAEMADKDSVITNSISSHDGALNTLSDIKNGSSNAKTPRRTGLDLFRWPVTGRVLSKFGDKRSGQRNEGIDISVPEGTSVKAAENGVVIYASSELRDYGNLLLVRHGDGWVSAYAHNKILNVKRGEKVRRGQIIARSGRTGNATRPVLHFELRKDSVPVNPKKYLR